MIFNNKGKAFYQKGKFLYEDAMKYYRKWMEISDDEELPSDFDSNELISYYADMSSAVNFASIFLYIWGEAGAFDYLLTWGCQLDEWAVRFANWEINYGDLLLLMSSLGTLTEKEKLEYNRVLNNSSERV